MPSPKIGEEPIKDKEKKKKKKIFKRERDDMGNKGRKGKGPKPMNEQRFQGSTKPLGNTKAISSMIKKDIGPGLSAQLGAALYTTFAKKKTLEKAKEPIIPSNNSTPPALNIAPVVEKTLAPKMKKTATESFKPSKRDMELKEAHLGTKGKGPKVKKPKSKSIKPKSPKRNKKIKGKF